MVRWGFQVCCCPATTPVSAYCFDSECTPSPSTPSDVSTTPALGQGQRLGDFYGQSPGSPVNYSVFDGFSPEAPGCDCGCYSGISQGYSGYHLGPYSDIRAAPDRDSLAVQGRKRLSESSDAAKIAWLSSQVEQQARRADNAELRFKTSRLERAEAIRDRDLALRREATLRYRLDEATANLSSSQQKARMLEKLPRKSEISGM